MIFTILLLIFGIRIGERGETSYFTKEQFNAVKGVAAFYIMLCHIHMFATYKTSGGFLVLYPLNDATILLNGCFMFFSGYGLFVKYRTADNYISLVRFINRIYKICLPAYSVYLLWYFIGVLPKEESFSISTLIHHILLGNIIEFVRCNDVTWFVIELVVLYVLFWIFYKLFGEKIGKRCLLACILGWIIAAYLTGRGVVWYASTVCFAVGIYTDELEKIVNKKWVKLGTPILFFCSFAIYCFVEKGTFAVNAVIGNVATCSFVMVVVLILKEGVLFGNGLSNFLGNISYEIYLLNMITVKFLSEVVKDEKIIILGTIALTIFASALLHYLNGIVDTAIRRRIGNEK